MEQRTREYELLYIIPATFTDDEIGTVEGNVKALLEKNGATLLKTDRLGKLRFAYPIKKVRHGHYVLVRLTADTQAVAAVETALRISSDVLRHIIVRADEVGDGKFEMVQFIEVNLDAKDDRPRRRREDAPAAATPEKKEIKEGVEAIEAGSGEAPKAADMSAEELEKKIDSALEEKA
jgi:small subunit ribosomal protein S6